MKIIAPVLSLTLVSLFLSPLPALSAETDPAKLIDSLNRKTAKIRGEKENEEKNQALTTKNPEVNPYKNLETNSYIFALDRKEKMEIEFNEEIQSFENGQYIDKNLTVGKATFDPAEIDPERIEVGAGLLSINCRDLKNCVNHEYLLREINTKGEITYERTNNSATYGFHLSGLYNQTLAEQIKKDLQALFTLLAPLEPAPKPER